MSDSGFSGLPPRTGISEPAYPPSRADLKAQIIEIRGEAKARDTKQRMEGEIIRHDDKGQSRIRTDKGEVTVRFQTKNPPPEGTRVTIELPPEKAGPRATASIQVAPETAPHTAPKQSAQPQTTAQSKPPPLPLAPDTIKYTGERASAAPYTQPYKNPAAPLQTGQLVRLLPYTGTILYQNPATAPTGALNTVLNLSPNAAATTISQDIASSLPPSLKPLAISTSTSLPEQNFLPAPPLSPKNETAVLPFRTETSLQPLITALTSVPLFQGTGPGSSESAGAASGTAKNQPFALIDARIDRILSPAAQLKSAENLLSPIQGAPSSKPETGSAQTGQIRAGENSAMVIGHTPEGLPVLSLFAGSGLQAAEPSYFALQFMASNLPSGTLVHFVPEATATASQAQSLAGTGQTSNTLPASYALPATLPAQHWPAFEELLQTLQQTSPQVAQAVSNTIPSPANPAAMSPAILFFVAALRSGDIQSWLGERTLDIVRKSGKGDILGRIARDVSVLSRGTAEPASQDWRMLSLPLYWQGDVQKLQLYYRHDKPPQKDDDAETKQGTRFIFDLDLNRMGNVQLDGLHRPGAAQENGRLDLILRTVSPLSETMQQKMRQTYYNALTKAGVHGEMQFQGKAERFIKINAATPHHESVI